jgi:hypothetical protein
LGQFELKMAVETPPTVNGAESESEATALSKQYETPMGLAHTTIQALKDRIKLHYDLASDYYLSLWYVPHAMAL